MQKIMKIKKIKPMFTSLVTTMDKYTDTQYIAGSGLIDTSKIKSGIKEYQKVIAVGEMVRGINVGDIVCINPAAYAEKKYRSDSIKDGIEGMNPVINYNFNVVVMNDKEYLLLQDRDIEFVVTEFDED